MDRFVRGGRLQAALMIAAMTSIAAPASADVVDRAATGFTVKISTPVNAPPEIVYASLVRHVGEWWDPAHTYSGDSKNLSIIAEPGGCFCEALANGGGVQHGTVVNVAPGLCFEWSGRSGPSRT